MILIPELRAELRDAAGRAGQEDGRRARNRLPGASRSGRIRIAAGFVVVAAVAVALVAVGHSRSGQSDWARQTLHRAAAVIVPTGSPNTILHLEAVETFTRSQQEMRRKAGEPVIPKLIEQAWIREGNRGQERVVLHVPGGPVLETNYRNSIYDQTTNTVYPAPRFPRSQPRYTVSTTAGGHARLKVVLPGGGIYTKLVDTNVVRKLRDGSDVVRWGLMYFDPHTGTNKVVPTVQPKSEPAAQPGTQQPDPATSGFAAELRMLLSSRHARVTRSSIDGQSAIKISTLGVHDQPPSIYYVHPGTYTPIELDLLSYGDPANATRVKFTTYRTLPLAGHRRLLQVRVPASARVDHSAAGYAKAASLPQPF